jgi:membrane protein YqaA with SNARE-associated domain
MGVGKKENGPKTLGPSVDSNCSKFQQLKFVCCNATKPGSAYTALAMDAWIPNLLHLLALPEYSLTTVFVVSFVSATLLPMGSEPVVLSLVQLNPSLFWPVIGVATVGNTLGGAVTWWMGFGAHRVTDKYRSSAQHVRALAWLEKLGPKACLLAWLPLVGDPLCAVAGWLKLPFWPCVAYMAAGKFLRYLWMTIALMGLIRLW